MEFLLGGASSMCAVLFTNPLDVLKTRQQLEGELIAKQNLKKRAYKGFRQSVTTVIQTDGLRGLQKGLPAALLFQFSMNSVRLGTYQTANDFGWTKSTQYPSLTPLLSLLWGGCAGLVSATASCPFYVVKTQLQAVTAGSYTARFQHHHSGTLSAFGNIYQQSGIRGLFRGYPASVARLVVGSAAEMASFSVCKEFFLRYQVFQESIVLTALASSTVAGFFTSVLMSPCDVVTTRMTNQGRAFL
ncbi:solute carrier family 25 member 34-like [Anopheles funestus]|uniref:solute carrier family 25 member 34-like n=1 Tax=Anopheles funestus TaxID=62324 RepID=UPI0020C722BC|nr:solute carrier family 25 member 34-like [Anopheles funestus]